MLPATSFFGLASVMALASFQELASSRNIGISRDRGNVGIDFSDPSCDFRRLFAASFLRRFAGEEGRPMAFEDILLRKNAPGVATITINRPKVLNAFSRRRPSRKCSRRCATRRATPRLSA